MLSDILITPLNRIQTYGGDVLHAMKFSDYGFSGFGEAYFSYVDYSMVKGWKKHNKMTLNLIVPLGHVKFVFASTISSSNLTYRVKEIGLNHYARITVPPGIWFAFQGIHYPSSLVLNLANISHDPTEIERLPLNAFPFSWSNL